MFKKRLFFVTEIIFAGSVLLAQSNNDEKENMKVKQEAKLLEVINKTNSSSILNISGMISDDDGKLLDGVSLELDFSRSKGWDNDHLNRKIISNSQFSIEQSGYTGLTVDFQKDGYFSERKSYSTQQSSKDLKDYVFIKNDEKIVLRKIGQLAKIKKINKKLRYDFKNNTQSICNLSDLSYETLPIDSAINYSKCILLDFERDKDGKILTVENKSNGTTIPKTLIVKYASKDKDDGFIIEGNKKDLSYLSVAPDTEYAIKEIKIQYESEPIYFYFKNGNRYGKGWAGYALTQHQTSRVILELMQNIETDPKEKRNLCSLEK